MKVIISIPCLLTGGTEIQTLNLVHALISGGHQVTTVCYFEHTDRMIQNYRQAGSDVILLSKEGTRVLGWKVIPFLWKGLRNAVKKIQPDVVHVQYMAPGAIPIVLLKMMGVKTILATAHTAADIYPSLKLVHFIQRHCVKAFTCITERAEQSFFGSSKLYSDEYILQEHNHFTIYNALPSYIQIRKDQKSFNQERMTIGVVSRLEPIKGMDLIIPAFAKVKENFPDARLLIVGDGSLKELMHKQAEDLQLMESIEWAGRQGQDTIQSYYDKIDILCMPSRSEGFGLTAIEGMARGCVVVASDVGGLPEVVLNGKVGLLHKSENIGVLADKIELLLEKKSLMEEMSRRAIVHASTFSIHIFNKIINKIYTQL